LPKKALCRDYDVPSNGNNLRKIVFKYLANFEKYIFYSFT
jgi:hypothetical protein